MRCSLQAALTVLTVGGLFGPVSGYSQQSAGPTGFPPYAAPNSDSAEVVRTSPGDSLARAAEVAGPDAPPANLPRAVLGVTAVNALAVGINVLWRDEPSTNPGSWWDNLNGGWEWDPNPIRVNSFEHPWAGAAYYNMARANGLNFYEAVPVTALGSMIWEIFGEPRPPATNDLITTTLGGVVLGEPLRKLSIAVLDNGASGFDRFWREATVFVFNPGLGLDRLSRGQLWSQSANPADRRLPGLRGGMSFGAVRLAPADGLQRPDAEAARLRFDLSVGNPFDGEKVTPFSSFTGSLELSSLSAVLTRLDVRGLIATLGDRSGPTDRVVGVFLDFDYRWDGRVGFAEQGIGLGMLSRFGTEEWRLTTDITAELLPLLATTDRRARDVSPRYYEFGSGLGGRAGARLSHRGVPILSGSLRAYWSVTLDGASSSKVVQLAELEARTPRLGSLSLGADLRLYRQSSSYDDLRSGHESMSSVSLFVAYGD